MMQFGVVYVYNRCSQQNAGVQQTSQASVLDCVVSQHVRTYVRTYVRSYLRTYVPTYVRDATDQWGQATCNGQRFVEHQSQRIEKHPPHPYPFMPSESTMESFNLLRKHNRPVKIPTKA